VTYGFLSTYQQTIFVKRVKYNGNWELWVSRVFRYDKTTSTRSTQLKYEDIPVRLAMLALVRMARTDPGKQSAEPPMEIDKTWVVPESTLERGKKMKNNRYT